MNKGVHPIFKDLISQIQNMIKGMEGTRIICDCPINKLGMLYLLFLSEEEEGTNKDVS